MTLFDFARKNILRDSRSYSYYFINCLFSVFVFFLFSTLSFHPSMAIIDKNSAMGLILMIGEIISIGFSLIFISVSVAGFLKIRSRQFGIITILGASKKQLNKLIFTENILVGGLSIVTGIALGLLFSKVFLDIAGNAIGDVDFFFYFPVKAIILTTCVLGLVFFALAWFTPKFVRKEKIISLIKSDRKAEKPLKLLLPLSIFTISLAAVVFFLTSKSKFAVRMVDGQVALLFFAILFVSGIFLLTSGLQKAARWIAKRNGTYYKGVNLIHLSDCDSKQRTISVGVTLTTILYSIAFFSLVVLLSQSGNVTEETDAILPYAVQYIEWDAPEGKSDGLETIRRELSGMEDYRESMIALYSFKEYDGRVRAMKESDYNDLMGYLHRDRIDLEKNEAFFVKGDADGKRITDVSAEASTILGDSGLMASFAGYADRTIVLSGLAKQIMVLDDFDFERIHEQLKLQPVYVFDYKDKYQQQEIADRLNEIFKVQTDSLQVSLSMAYEYYRSSQIQNDMTLYIGSILCFSFLVAVLSFVFSRLYTDLEKDCARLNGIVKLGLSQKELAKILRQTVRRLLLDPFLIALGIMWASVMIIDQDMIVSVIPATVQFTVIAALLQTIFLAVMERTYKNKVFGYIYAD